MMHNWRHVREVPQKGAAALRPCLARMRRLVTPAVVRPPLTPGLTAESWHARCTVAEQNEVARARQPDGFPLSWAERMLREALCRSSLLDSRRYEIFCQGSRVNNTYIEDASDIDLVLMLRMPFESNIEDLDAAGMNSLSERHQVSPYGWGDFRDDVLATLSESYVVSMGRRCVNVEAPDSLFGEMVDILLAKEYRLYSAFPGPGVELYEQGVFFRDREGQPIVNFPKQHRRNGDEKDLRTGGRFKGVVRTTKKIRRLAERERMITEGAAPSYLLECLLYNVPDHVYRTSSLTDAYRRALEWLRRCYHEDPVSFGMLPCQNGINWLFGPGPDQWEPGGTGRIVDVLHQI
jgi:Nucleotidyltransferase domain